MSRDPADEASVPVQMPVVFISESAYSRPCLKHLRQPKRHASMPSSNDPSGIQQLKLWAFYHARKVNISNSAKSKKAHNSNALITSPHI
eukprot:1143941-Pelagomonas_calceolata.AAC.4